MFEPEQEFSEQTLWTGTAVNLMREMCLGNPTGAHRGLGNQYQEVKGTLVTCKAKWQMNYFLKVLKACRFQMWMPYMVIPDSSGLFWFSIGHPGYSSLVTLGCCKLCQQSYVQCKTLSQFVFNCD